MNLPSRSDQLVVPILGMHRSGTSLTTRLLNLLGLSLGNDLQSAADDNKTGFWEHRFFQMVNMEFLEGFGLNSAGYAPFSQLHSVARRCQGLPLSPTICDQITTAVEKEFASSKTWGFKDPRSVLMWPFWREFFVSQGWSSLKPVIVFRKPAGCLNSLLRRRDVESASIQYGVVQTLFLSNLWYSYNQILMRSSAMDCSPLFIQYEDLLNPKLAPIEISRMAHHISAPMECRQIALDWIDPSLNNAEPWGYQIDSRALKLEKEIAILVHRQRVAFMRQTPPDEWLKAQLS